MLQKRLELYFQDIYLYLYLYLYGGVQTYPEHVILTSNMLLGCPTLSGSPLGVLV